MRVSLRKLAATGVGILTLVVASAGPAFAGGASSGDPTGDTLDPVLASTDAQRGLPGYYTNSPATDITGWSITSGNVGGTPVLTMDMDVVSAVQPCATAPCAPPSLPYAGYNGAEYMVTFQDINTELNQLVDLCSEVDGVRTLHGYYGHWQDGFRFYISLDVNYNGVTTTTTPSFGYYTPDPTSTDSGYRFFDLAHSPASGLVQSSVSGNHIRVQVPTVFNVNDSTCANGLESWAPVNFGHTIKNASAISFLDQSVVLPVALPLSITCADPTGTVCEDDLQAIGGFITSDDWTTLPGPFETYDIGLLPQTGDNVGPGAGCNTPTFGGLLPQNPLYTAGSPCQIDNPFGPHYIPSGLDFTV